MDSGKDGAIIDWQNNTPVMAYEIPYDEAGKFIDLDPLFDLDCKPFFIEKITPYAPNSKTIAVQFQAYGALVSAAQHLSDGQMWLIPVPTWQSFARKQRGFPPRSKWTKNDSRALAMEHWPEFCDTVIKRVLHDGIADALVIGSYVIGELRSPD